MTKLPTVPKARFTDAGQQRQADAVQNLTDILTGKKGNGLDRAVLVRDLIGGGLVNGKKLGNGQIGIGNPSPAPLPNPDEEVLNTPPAPVGVEVSGAFTSILVTWDTPDYVRASAAAYTEVYRNSSNELATAVQIATTSASVYSDPVGTDSHYYYWVRHVNVGKFGGTKAGPFSGADGVYGETNRDIGKVLEDITEHMLSQDIFIQLQASDKNLQDALDQAVLDLQGNDGVLQGNLDAANGRIDKANEDLAAANSRLDQTNSDLAAAKKALEGADSQLATDLAAANSKIDQAKTDLAAADNQLSTALTKAQTDLAAADAALQGGIDGVDGRLTSTKEALERADGDLQAGLSSTNVELSKAKAELAEADTALDGKVSQVKSDLQNADSAIQSSLDSAKAELEGEVARVETGYKDGDTANLTTIKDLEKTVADVSQVIAQQISQLNAAFETRSDAETATTDAKITETKRVLADADQALSETLTALEAAYKAADATLSGSISSLAKTVADEDQALSQRIDKVESDYKAADSTTNASITSLSETMATGDQALSTRLDGVESAYKAADSATNATITTLQKTVADGDSALSEQIDGIDAGYKSADAAINGSVNTLSQTVADNKQAISQRVDTVESQYKEADTATNAAVTSLTETVASNEAAASSRMDGIESDYQAADATLTGSVNSLSKTVTDNQAAISSRVDQVESDYKAADAETSASISTLAETVSREDGALASRVDNVQAGIDSLSGSIMEQKEVDATTDKILAMQLSQLDAAYSARSGAETATTDAKITESQRVLTEADQALAEDIKTVDAAYKKANEALAGTIAEQLKVVADENQVTSQRLDTVESSINGENGLAAKVETNASAISSIDKDGSQAHKALWETKASVGDITAGIGLVVDGQGKSQAVVSASQFFVYDPNQPATITPLFAIDGGQVIIPDALIEKAAVRILNAQEITAHNIVADASITTPTLIGATGSFEDVISTRGTFSDAKMIRAIIENATIAGTLTAKSATIEDVTLERATISGTLVSVDGTFTGTVQVGDSFYVDDDLVRVNSNKFYVTTPNGDKPLLAISDNKLTMPHVTVGALDVVGTARIADGEAIFNARNFWVYNENEQFRTQVSAVSRPTPPPLEPTSQYVELYGENDTLDLSNSLLDTDFIKTIRIKTCKQYMESGYASEYYWKFLVELIVENSHTLEQLRGYILHIEHADFTWAILLDDLIDSAPWGTFNEINAGDVLIWTWDDRNGGPANDSNPVRAKFAYLDLLLRDKYNPLITREPGLTVEVKKPWAEREQIPAFSVVNGKVVIPDLLVKDAVIKTLEAQTIVADEVAANTKLTSPVISGGQIDIGGNFSVNPSGHVTAKSMTMGGTGSSRLTITQNRIDVYHNGVLRCRLGEL